MSAHSLPLRTRIKAPEARFATGQDTFTSFAVTTHDEGSHKGRANMTVGYSAHYVAYTSLARFLSRTKHMQILPG